MHQTKWSKKSYLNTPSANRRPLTGRLRSQEDGLGKAASYEHAHEILYGLKNYRKLTSRLADVISRNTMSFFLNVSPSRIWSCCETPNKLEYYSQKLTFDPEAKTTLTENTLESRLQTCWLHSDIKQPQRNRITDARIHRHSCQVEPSCLHLRGSWVEEIDYYQRRNWSRSLWLVRTHE